MSNTLQLKRMVVFVKKIRKNHLLIFNQVVVWNTFQSVLTGIGILLLIPLLSLTSLDESNQTGFDSFRLPNAWPYSLQLSIVLCLYVSLIGASVLVQRKAAVLNATFLQRYIKTLRDNLFERIFESEVNLVSSEAQSRYVSLFSNEIGRISIGVQGLLQLLTIFLVAVPQVAIAFYLSPWLTVYVLMGGSLLFFSLYHLTKRVRVLGLELHQLHRTLQQDVQDQLNGLKEMKSYGVENQYIHTFSQTTSTIQDNIVAYTKQQTKSDAVYKLGAALLIGFFLWIGFLVFEQRVTSMILVLFIFARLWPSFSSSQRHLQSILTAIPAFEAYETAMRQLAVESMIPTHSVVTFQKTIRLERVSYRYPATEQDVLHRLDLSIQAGTTVALTGASGIGKSTVLDLLLLAIMPTDGRILVDDNVLSVQHRTQWLENIAYVPQHPYLFYGTVEENIRKWHPGLTDESMHEAIRLADASFVYDLPDGLQTQLGDFGHSLSGGQRQRIVLARALAKRPKLLVLDEATAALDELQERQIHQTIHALKHEMTILYITHRRAVADMADQVIHLGSNQKNEEVNRVESI